MPDLIGTCAGCHGRAHELIEDLCASCWPERHNVPLRVYLERWKGCRVRPLVLDALWRRGQRCQKLDAASRAAAARAGEPTV